MNVTSRIEDVTAGGEILIADSTLHSPRGDQYRDRRQPVRLKVKGIAESIVVHQVKEVSP